MYAALFAMAVAVYIRKPPCSEIPSDRAADVLAGAEALISSDLLPAIRHLEGALIAAPELAASAQLHNRLGELRANHGDLHGAEAALRKALELDPAYVRAMGTLANVLAESGRSGLSMGSPKELEALRLALRAKQMRAAERGEGGGHARPLHVPRAPWLDPAESEAFMRRVREDAPAALARRDEWELQFLSEKQARGAQLNEHERRRKAQLEIGAGSARADHRAEGEQPDSRRESKDEL
jgi:tetratricopeptide (TPR) repeat protein